MRLIRQGGADGLCGSAPLGQKRAASLAAELGLEAEEFQEIELAWQSTAQRSLGHAPQAQAVLVEGLLETAPAAAAKLESFAAAEPAREEAVPPEGPEPEEKTAGGPKAAAAPARKRGRPKKTEGGGEGGDEEPGGGGEEAEVAV